MSDVESPKALPSFEITPELKREVHRLLGDPDFDYISVAFLASQRVTESFATKPPDKTGLIEDLTHVDTHVEEALQPKIKLKQVSPNSLQEREADAPIVYGRRAPSRAIHTTDLQKEIDADCDQKREKLVKEYGNGVSQFRGIMTNFEEKALQLHSDEAWPNKTEAQKLAYLILNLLVAIRKGLTLQYQPSFALSRLEENHPVFNKILVEVERTRPYFNWLLAVFETE